MGECKRHIFLPTSSISDSNIVLSTNIKHTEENLNCSETFSYLTYDVIILKAFGCHLPDTIF
ncbi:hypothetical protein KUCAC02_021377 [Chaenocephalus aceratus]|uniref:Uncharacterized protein n=1 Tax=Chaenocephalus aceratus TaxID=36190 RepID=A0ACB9XFA2_CHAAC|nr:hypothetical protein KUCAC02_021377 [Chaenocephalus aceratus]